MTLWLWGRNCALWVGRSEYFVTFREAASSAALPAVAEVKRMYDAAHVWMLVKSQVVYLPLDHGTSIAPSGLFPSVHRRPGGSLELGMSALKSDLHMMSFIAKWRLARAPDCLQTSPWWPLGSVVSPHWHWCGTQRFRPRPFGPLHYLLLLLLLFLFFLFFLFLV